MRLSEVLKLRKDGINFKDGRIYIHDTKSGTPKRVPMNKTLTEADKRGYEGGQLLSLSGK